MIEDARIISNVEIAKDVYKMELETQISKLALPGQFIEISVPGFFLRRPISINEIKENKGSYDKIFLGRPSTRRTLKNFDEIHKYFSDRACPSQSAEDGKRRQYREYNGARKCIKGIRGAYQFKQIHLFTCFIIQ